MFVTQLVGLILMGHYSKGQYQMLPTHHLHAVRTLQSWSEEAAATAQAWVDTCSMAHGPPSSRMIGGIIYKRI